MNHDFYVRVLENGIKKIEKAHNEKNFTDARYFRTYYLGVLDGLSLCNVFPCKEFEYYSNKIWGFKCY